MATIAEQWKRAARYSVDDDEYFADVVPHLGLKTRSGHAFTGYFREDAGELWFRVVDENGREYETWEEPQQTIDMTNATAIQARAEDVLKLAGL